MRLGGRTVLTLPAIFVGLVLLHWPLLRLPYFWDEAGYYIPAALDFYRAGWLIPQSTLPTGHPPLVMIYLGMAWWLFGFSPLVTRVAMVLMAAVTVASLYALGRRVACREAAAWSALLLSLMPLFFAQSSLVHLDLAAALFTTLSVLCVLNGRLWVFALTASLAVLNKETAAVLLPLAWVFEWWRARQALPSPATQSGGNSGTTGAHRGVPLRTWIALTVPLLCLLGWSVYYYRATGYWTGNREYLAYNLYSTLTPGRIFWTLLRRLYETFIGGFNWLLTAGAIVGLWWGKRNARGSGGGSSNKNLSNAERHFVSLTAGLMAIYLLMLSVIGGAVLPRYLLPIFPAFILLAVMFLWRLPVRVARVICVATAACFVWAWFINPPYPFPFEDNLAYADFVSLHQQAAGFLEAQPGRPRILTPWPASDELARPFLGYVHAPLRVVPMEGFTARDFRDVVPESFDLLYLYPRKWKPRNDWVERFHFWRDLQERYFDYQPQMPEDVLVARHRLRLLHAFERRGQWVRVYSRR